MFITKHHQLVRWIIIIASFIIISLILWNTYSFFQNLKAEERLKMENWAHAQKEINERVDLNKDISNLSLKIIESNTSNPMIIVNEEGNIGHRNIDETKTKDSLYMLGLISKFKQENDPIESSYNGKVINTMYYGNSTLLNKLKYYPLALLLIIFLFGAVVYFFYKSSKTAIQNKLWSGMAKETAHQIGTPLSSLIGWTEILKSENTNPEYIVEIEKDINRLQTITERFSKIGSLPKLEKTNIVEETKEAFDYLRRRSSKLIDFELNLPEKDIFVNLNKQLYGWTIENMVKNGIDAMKGKGKLTLEMATIDKDVKIIIKDTGKGIPKKDYSTIFEPGHTTKKRGWGLGLSLAKRIVEDFHDGKIKVLHSEIDKGTTMVIVLKVL